MFTIFDKQIESFKNIEIMKTVTKDDFHLKTKATFNFVGYGDIAFQIYNSLKKDNGEFFRSTSGSKYVVVDNEVYRLSDHWGMVASCKWSLRGCPKMPTWKTNWVLAKCRLEDFEDMKKAVEYIQFEGMNKKTNRNGKWTIISSQFENVKLFFDIFTQPEKVIYFE